MQTFEPRRKPSKKEIFTYIVKKNQFVFYSIINICFFIVAVLKGHISFIDILSCFAVAFTSVYLFSFIRRSCRNRIVYKVEIDETSQEIAFHYFFMIPRVDRIPFSEFHYDCLIYPKAKMGGQIIISKNNNATFSSIFRFVLQHRDMWDECTWDIQDLIDLSVYFEKISLKYETWEPYAFKKLPRLQRDEKIIWSKRWSEEDYQRIRIIGPQF